MEHFFNRYPHQLGKAMKPLIILLFSALTLSASAQLCDPNTHSMLFDGTTSYISFAPNNDFNLTEKITIEAWIKATAWVPVPLFGTIVSKHGWTMDERGFALRAGGNGQLSFVIAGVDQNGNYQGWKEVTSDDGELELNTWHHVAGVYDKKKLKIYVDGDLVKSVNFNGTIRSSNDYNLHIGRIADDGAPNGRFWKGYIDEVRIWEKSVSENDLDDHKDEHINANSGDLQGYCQFNEGSGTSVIDATSGSSSGIVNSVSWNTDVPFTNGVLRPIITQIGSDLYSNALLNNQWNLNGVPISGETGISITPYQTGLYSVTSTNIIGCTATSIPFPFIATGIEDVLENNISILYNQVEQTISFRSVKNLTNVSLSIIDSYGRRMLTEDNIYLSESYNLEGFPAGIYHVIFTFNNNMYSKSFFCY